MIHSLQIKNLALISNVSIAFSEGLNVLSGETGAGKSIIVDSLILLLGGRYDKTILRFGEKNGFVEAVFDAEKIKDQIEELGFEYEDQVVICRKFNSEGKNEIRINGRVVTLSMLKKITPFLFDLCGQNEHQSLGTVSNHIKVLDYYVRRDSVKLKEEIKSLLDQLRDLNSTINSIGDEQERRKNADFLSFQIEEIESANVKDGEENELVDLRKKMYSVETVKESLTLACNSLSDGYGENAVSMIENALQNISKIEKYGELYKSLSERLDKVISELDDVSALCKDELDTLDFSDEDLDNLEKRLAIVRNISKKYGSGEKLKDTYEKLKHTLFEIENADEIYEKALKNKKIVIDKLYLLCKKLSTVRKNGANDLEKLVESELSTLGMQSKFEIRFSDFPSIANFEKSLTSNGVDEVEFYLSANLGQPLNPLVKIISGGELSRLMLAFKVVSSKIDNTPSVVFDEIDTGISGKIGLEVAKKLAQISKDHQVLCVTHLPQICSMADKNFYISKSSDGKETFTKVKNIDGEEVYEEIARLTGAKDISDQSLKAALDMKEWSEKFKQAL